MSDHKSIEELEALLDELDRKVEEYDGLRFGDRGRIVEDNENLMIYEGEEGYVILETVGAPEYGNVHTGVYFLVDGSDSPMQVTSDLIEVII